VDECRRFGFGTVVISSNYNPAYQVGGTDEVGSRDGCQVLDSLFLRVAKKNLG